MKGHAYADLRRVRRAALAALALLAPAGLHLACSTGEPAAPRVTPAGSAGASNVGPAPLRRMSDAEYLNALHDLFPSLAPASPELPADVPVAGFDNAAEAQTPSDVLVARYEQIADL